MTLQRIDRRLRRTILLVGLVSLGAYLAVQAVSPRRPLSWSSPMLEAAQTMAEAIAVVGAERADRMSEFDPNATGLIGPEYGDLFTSLGDPEAKRTTTNPDMAALLVHLLQSAGVAEGDTIAVGCSASFPALLIAVLSAAQAMDVHPVVIVSLGASSWGATDSRFTLLDIYELLLERAVFSTPPAAVSLGGNRDTGEEFEPAVREKLVEWITVSGIPIITEPDLRRNVAARMGFYSGEEGWGALAAFINIGGAYTNLGTSPLVLEIEPGLIDKPVFPEEKHRGVLFEMAAADIPVLHLLYIRGLALRFGLPWDPIPLPEAGSTGLHDARSGNDPLFTVIAVIYLLTLVMTVFFGVIRPSGKVIQE